MNRLAEFFAELYVGRSILATQRIHERTARGIQWGIHLRQAGNDCPSQPTGEAPPYTPRAPRRKRKAVERKLQTRAYLEGVYYGWHMAGGGEEQIQAMAEQMIAEAERHANGGRG